MNKNILIFGAGQFGLMIKEIVESINCFDKADFLDDDNEIAIGKLSDYEKFSDDYRYAVVAIGNPDVRLSYIQKLEVAAYEGNHC